MENNKFKEYENAYDSIKESIQTLIKEAVKENHRYFTNSDYFHYLALTDYQLNDVKERLYIVTKGFLTPYQGILKEKFKNAIEQAKKVIVLSTSDDENVKDFFTKELGVRESDFFQDTQDKRNHFIVTDNTVRESSAPCDEKTSAKDIKADVTLNNEFYADDIAKELENAKVVKSRRIV